jgi:hypothetical protein
MNYIAVSLNMTPSGFVHSYQHTSMSDMFKDYQLMVHHIWNGFLYAHMTTLLMTNGYGDYIYFIY